MWIAGWGGRVGCAAEGIRDPAVRAAERVYVKWCRHSSGKWVLWPSAKRF